MKIYDYKLTKPLSWCLVLCMSLIMSTVGFSQANFCDDQVNIALGPDCLMDITEGLFTEGVADAGFTVQFEQDGWFSAEYTVPYIGLDVSGELQGCGYYTVHVTNLSGVTCWGSALIEDKLGPIPPMLNCGNTWDDACPWSCLEEAPDYNPASDLLLAQDCTLPITVTGPAIVITPNVDCAMPDSAMYIYTLTDGKGNESLDTVFYLISKPDVILAPVTVITGRCQDADDPKTLLDAWVAAGENPAEIPVPYAIDPVSGDIVPVEFGAGETVFEACNLVVKYSDMVIPLCGADCVTTSRKVLRNWTVLDWCNSLTYEFDQILHFKDEEAPYNVTVAGGSTDYVSTDPWSCTVTYTLPGVTAEDACSAIAGTIWKDADGLVVTGSVVLGKGAHTFYAHAVDCCDNVSDGVPFTVYVADEIKPVAIAKEYTVASVIEYGDEDDIEGGAIAKVFAPSIDNGSWDMCTEVYLEVRRIDENNEPLLDICDRDDDLVTNEYATDSPAAAYPEDDRDDRGYAPFVKFCCDDVGESHMVELRVWDDANMDGIYGSYGDNYNVTWGWVKVEDPNPPRYTLEDVTVYCHDPYDDEGLFDDLYYSKLEFDGACYEPEVEIEGPHWFGFAPSGVSEPSPSDFGDYYYDWNTFPDFDYTCSFGYGWVKYTMINPTKNARVTDYQLIKVMYKDDFACDNVNWPADDPDRECMDDTPIDLTWDAGPCEIIAWSYESDTFSFSPNTDGSCAKILNYFTVIDWCIYDAWLSGGYSSTLLSTHYSLWAHDYDKNDNGLLDDNGDICGDVLVDEVHDVKGSFKAIADLVAYNSCNPDPCDEEHHVTGVYTYVQTIKILDDTDPEIDNTTELVQCSYDPDCADYITISASATDEGDCEASYTWKVFVDYDQDGYYDRTFDYTGPSISQTFGDINDDPIAMYEGWVYVDVRLKVWDGCGNSSIEDMTIELKDCKAPTPYCLNLSSALMNVEDFNGETVGMVELWAIDFNVGSTDNCFGKDLDYTFDNISYDVDYEDYWHYFEDTDGDGFGEAVRNASGKVAIKPGSSPTGSSVEDADDEVLQRYLEGEIQLWDPNEDAYGARTSAIVFTCDDLNITFTPDIIMTVWDGKYNHDFCSVNLTLIDNQDACGGAPRAAIAGDVSTEENNEVSEVTVSLENLTNPEYKLDFVTGNDGDYAFASNPMYNSYDISAKKDGDDIEGVSTLDLVLIQRHILGLDAFDSPYKVIAADINSDRKVSGSDLVVLRKTILGIYNEFPSNNSWRFVDAAQTLTVENALVDFSEVINIADLEVNMPNENFVAVKIGDVNASAATNARSIATTRSNNTVALGLTERNVRSGETVDLTFSAAEFQEVYGYQFTLELNGLEFVSVTAGDAGMTDANIGIFDNTLTVSYSDVKGLNATDNLFTLTAKATQDGKVSQMVNLTNSKLSSEAYVGSTLDINTVELTVNGEEVVNFGLNQNEPNPFKDATVIGFTLPEAGQAFITVYDVAGKVVKQINGQYAQGFNQETLTKSDLNATGVLYYTLKSGNYTATKKMIIIE